MATLACHHALASPDDVEAWCGTLLDSKTRSTSYNYWVRVRRFYDWLQWHVDHPHCYNPVLMAVVEGEASSEIWEQKLDKWRRARGAAFDDD